MNQQRLPVPTNRFTATLSQMTKTSLFLLVFLLLICGCQGNRVPATQTDPPLSNGDSAGPPLLAGDREGPEQPPSTEESLVLWAPPFFSIDTADRADAVLAAVLAELSPTAPHSPITLIAKAERGPAGILTYLLKTSQVASNLLPDVVLLNSFDLPRLVSSGLLVPLAQEESTLFDGIPPQILQTAQVEGSLYGLPFVANLDHLVYQKDRLLPPPVTWETFLSREKRLLFAAGSVDDYAITFAWTLYLIGGGTIDEQGDVVDPEILRSAFEFLSRSRELGLIPDSAVTLSSPQAVWTFFANGNTDMAVVPASLYYSQQSEGGAIGFAQLPTPDGTLRSAVTSWSFAIVTQEPERRQRALHLLQQLFAPNVQGEWSKAARQLPTQPDAFAYWDMSDPYAIFLRQMLANSVTTPNLPAFGDAHTMQQAQRELLAGEQSIEQLWDSLPFRP